jgi:catechol 2,3-dioxygenase-like lactoylglutathione lyase family enzyme
VPVPKLNATEIRPFIPAKDFALSKHFYTALGCQVKDVAPRMVLVKFGSGHFYIQDYYIEDVAVNSMLHITVEDAQAWYDHVAVVLRDNTFEGTRVQEPQRQSYGALVTWVHDPTGVLLHLCQWDR